MSNDTFWPSVRVRMPAASTAVACTNTSLPPPSGAIKPKPLEVLKNFTVPIVIVHFPDRWFPPAQHARTAVEDGDIRFGEVFRSSGAPSVSATTERFV